jgi:hypothetical protein
MSGKVCCHYAVLFAGAPWVSSVPRTLGVVSTMVSLRTRVLFTAGVFDNIIILDKGYSAKQYISAYPQQLMKRVIITGASGMIGDIVMQHCLASDEVREVLSIARKSSGLQHPKLKEIIPDDFTNFSGQASQFENIDIAFFCLGVYTGAVPDPEFKRITVDYTIHFADALYAGSPGATFCFLSGDGADRMEKSRMSFARYKGMAENHLLSRKFAQLYIFRPGYIYPVQKRTEPNVGYRIYRALYPLLRHVMGKNVSVRSTELGRAMFQAGMTGAAKDTLENRDILNLVEQ